MKDKQEKLMQKYPDVEVGQQRVSLPVWNLFPGATSGKCLNKDRTDLDTWKNSL